MPDLAHLTARNPRALVEVVLGRPVDWASIADPRRLVETVLETPYEELFDPVHDSPVHLGYELDDDGRVVAGTPRFANVEDHGGTDDDRFPTIDLDEIHHLADLKVLAGVALDELPVRRLVPGHAGGWTIEVGPPADARRAAQARIFPPAVLERLWAQVFPVDLGWTPNGAEWIEVAGAGTGAARRSFDDPLQGALADGWLVAAMSSVAWSMGYPSWKRSDATNELTFTDPATGIASSCAATDEVVGWAGTASPMFSRSAAGGTHWPALVEKAFAMWRAGTDNDHPNMTVLNGGDPVTASAALSGRTPHHHTTAGSTATELLTLVKAHSRSYRTVDPMTAWTYPTGADAPNPVRYDDANIVAGHAYSVLGWATGPQLLRPELVDVDVLWRLRGERDVGWRMRQDYLVLRNPWGFVDAAGGDLRGVVPIRDVGFWRPLDLATAPAAVDGVFAIDLPTFKRSFAGLGVAT